MVRSTRYKIAYVRGNYSRCIMELERKEYLQKLIQKKDNGRVKIITGIRRCGKSYLLKEIYKQYMIEQGVREDDILIKLYDIQKNGIKIFKEMEEFLKKKGQKEALKKFNELKKANEL